MKSKSFCNGRQTEGLGTSNQVVDQRNLMGTPKQPRLLPRLFVALLKLTISPLLLKRTVQLIKLRDGAYVVPSLLGTSVHSTRRYPGWYQRGKPKHNSSMSTSIYYDGQHAKYIRAMVP